MKKIISISIIFSILITGGVFAEHVAKNSNNIILSPLDSGWLLFIKKAEPFSVYLNDEFIGITPLLIEDMESGVLSIASDELIHVREVRVNKRNSDMTVYEPVMEQYKGDIFIKTTPPGADIFLDGEKIGTSPVEFRDIISREYNLDIKLDGHYFPGETISIPRRDTLIMNTDLKKQFSIAFASPLPENTEIDIFRSGVADTAVFHLNGEDPVKLPVGDWELHISGKTFFPGVCKVKVENSDRTIDFTPEFYTPKLVLNNLNPKSTVLLNGFDITGELQNTVISTEAGSALLVVKQKNFLDFNQKVEILKEEDTVLDVVYIKDPAVAKRTNRSIGATGISLGVAALISGAILNSDEIARDITPDYPSYSNLKYTSLGLMIGGLVFSGVGLLFALQS